MRQPFHVFAKRLTLYKSDGTMNILSARKVERKKRKKEISWGPKPAASIELCINVPEKCWR
jgi:hypothetical protein